MSGVKVCNENYCAACYFRTVAEYPNRKCLIQLTERCNLHCEHCFVSAENRGKMIDFDKFKKETLTDGRILYTYDNGSVAYSYEFTEI